MPIAISARAMVSDGAGSIKESARLANDEVGRYDGAAHHGDNPGANAMKHSFLFAIAATYGLSQAVAAEKPSTPVSARSGELTGLRKLMDTPLRDTSICRGPDGTWYLTYSCYIATATSLFGPYGERYEAIPHGGHTMFFKDEKGQWWSTYFGSDGSAPWRERPGVLPIEFDANGLVRPAKTAP